MEYMSPEDFKNELFRLLYESRKSEHPRLFRIERKQFSAPIADIRAYMDSELQALVLLKPYCFHYVICESDADHLTFLDIVPEEIVVGNKVERVNFVYDCDTRSVKQLITVVRPSRR